MRYLVSAVLLMSTAALAYGSVVELPIFVPTAVAAERRSKLMASDVSQVERRATETPLPTYPG